MKDQTKYLIIDENQTNSLECRKPAFEPTKLEVLAGIVSDKYRGMVDKKKQFVKKFEDFSDKVAPYINDFCLGLAYEQICSSFGKSGWNRANYLEDQLSHFSHDRTNETADIGMILGIILDVMPFFYSCTNGFCSPSSSSSKESIFSNHQANEVAGIYYSTKVATQLAAYIGRHFKQAYDAKKEELTQQKITSYNSLVGKRKN